MNNAISKGLISKGAVQSSKRPRLFSQQIWQKHELFPTPPFATRALFEEVLPALPAGAFNENDTILEPAAGLGHMSHVLQEYSRHIVMKSDVYCYELGDGLTTESLGICAKDFMDLHESFECDDWVITNPPFSLAPKFLARARVIARKGIALLQRIQWLETSKRFREVFAHMPPSLVAPFVERVPMCEGGFDPGGTTAAMYAWYVWARDADGNWPAPLEPFGSFPMRLIPPGQRERLSFESDRVLYERKVKGFVPPSRLKKLERGQAEITLEVSRVA